MELALNRKRPRRLPKPSPTTFPLTPPKTGPRGRRRQGRRPSVLASAPYSIKGHVVSQKQICTTLPSPRPKPAHGAGGVGDAVQGFWPEAKTLAPGQFTCPGASKINCKRTAQRPFWAAALLRRPSIFACGENLGAGAIYLPRAFQFLTVPKIKGMTNGHAFYFGAGMGTRTPTPKHENLNLACLPISSCPPAASAILPAFPGKVK